MNHDSRMKCTDPQHPFGTIVCTVLEFNSLPKDKISDWSKFKGFADDIIDANEMMICLSDRVENIVGKGENAGYQHFLLFSQCFQKLSFSGSLKVSIVW